MSECKLPADWQCTRSAALTALAATRAQLEEARKEIADLKAGRLADDREYQERTRERDEARAEVERLSTLAERLKSEAQIHAQEARTANASLAECYQVATGGQGEPGNWHGAEPIRQLVKERDEAQEALLISERAGRTGLRWSFMGTNDDEDWERIWQDQVAKARTQIIAEGKVKP